MLNSRLMSPVEYTSIELFGILFEEPVTSATDLLTATVCYFSFFQLWKLKLKNTAFKYFKYYFLFIGLGTMCAAFFSHAILYMTGYNWKVLGWTLSATGIFCIENAALIFYQQETKSKRFDWLSFAFKVQYIFFLLLMLYQPTRIFEVIQINSTIGILGATFPFFVYLFRETQRRGYRKIIIAFCMSMITGLVFNIEITFHKYYNYHDFSHTLMAFSSLLLFFGAKQLAKDLELV